jgi:hypothetical protein
MAGNCTHFLVGSFHVRHGVLDRFGQYVQVVPRHQQVERSNGPDDRIVFTMESDFRTLLISTSEESLLTGRCNVLDHSTRVLQ